MQTRKPLARFLRAHKQQSLLAFAAFSLLSSAPFSAPLSAQVTVTWNGPSAGAWQTPSNWLAGTMPGAGSIALVNNSATSIGLDVGSTPNNGADNQIVGAIIFSGTGASFTLGNSSTTDDGLLTLNSASGLLLQNSAAKSFTIQNDSAGGSKNLGLVLASSGTISVGAAGTIAISSIISQISGSQGFTKTASGALRLSAANTFTGSVTLSSGSTYIDDPSALGLSPSDVLLGDVSGSSPAELSIATAGVSLARNISVRAGSTGAATLSFSSATGSATFAGSISLNKSASFATTGGALNLTASIGGAGAATISTGLGGSVNFSGNNTYTGTTSVNFGFLGIGTNAPNSAAGALGNASTAVTIARTTAGDTAAAGLVATASNLTIGRAITVNSGNSAVAYIGSDSTQSLANVLYSNTLTLNKTVTMIGADVTYSGQITGAGGIIATSATVSTLNNSASNFTGSVSFNGTGSKIVAKSNNALGSTTGATNVSSGNALGFSGGINYSATETVNLNGTGVGGAGAIENVSGTNVFAGPISLQTDCSIGATSGQLTLSGIITGVANVNKVGAGTLILANSSNSFGTGRTLTISAGALGFSAGASFGGATLSLGNAILSYNGLGSSLSTQVSLLGGTNAAIEVNGSVTLSINNANSLSGAGASLTKLGAGSLQLLSPASYTGSTTIDNGMVRIGSGDNRLPTTTLLTLGDAIANTSGGLDLNDRNQTLAGLSSAGTGTASGAGNQIVNNTGAAVPTLTINPQTASTTFAGRLGGGANANSFSLAKSGAGMLILRGDNTYTGTTTVNAGTLIVDGTHGAGGAGGGGGAGDYSITANGTLGGIGAITFASGKKLSIAGDISPGDVQSGDIQSGDIQSGARDASNEVGSFTVNSTANSTTDFAPGGRYTWQFSSLTGTAGSDWDLLQLATASVSATTLAKFTIEIDSDNASVLASNLYPMTIATSSAHSFTAAMLDDFAIDASNVQANFPKPFTLGIADNGGSLVLTYTPEPSSMMMVVSAIGWCCVRRRRTSARLFDERQRR